MSCTTFYAMLSYPYLSCKVSKAIVFLLFFKWIWRQRHQLTCLVLTKPRFKHCVSHAFTQQTNSMPPRNLFMVRNNWLGQQRESECIEK